MNNNFEKKLMNVKDGYLWYCNIGIEHMWGNGKKSFINNYRLRNVEEVCILLTRTQDCLICRENPDSNYLSYMKSIGYEIPTFLSMNDQDSSFLFNSIDTKRNMIIKELKGKQYILVPYVYDEYIENVIHESLLKWLYRYPFAYKFNNKVFTNSIMKANGINCPESYCCSGYEEIREKCELLYSGGDESRVVLKKPFGASGSGNFLLNNINQLKSIIRVFLNEEENILVEKYYNDAESFNYQLYISDNGEIDVFQVSKQNIKGMIYKGTEFGCGVYDASLFEAIVREGEKVGGILYKSGVRGTVGIDGIYVEDMIYPAIDINARWTMSSYLCKVPSKMGKQKYYFAKINDLKMREALTYDDILFLLERENLLYTVEKGKGVFIYIAGTLPNRKDEKFNVYLGRVYSIIVGEDRSNCDFFYNKFCRLIGGLEKR